MNFIKRLFFWPEHKKKLDESEAAREKIEKKRLEIEIRLNILRKEADILRMRNDAE